MEYHLEDMYKMGEAGALVSPYGQRHMPPTIIIVHSTRSGIDGNADDSELKSTLSYFHKGIAGAHAVVDALGNVYWIVPLEWQAWGATYLNPYAVHIELTQPTTQTSFADGHYLGCAVAIKEISSQFPNLELVHGSGILGHDETSQGKSTGKSDPGYRFDWDKLMGLLEDESVDKAVIENALNVIWGWSERLEGVSALQAAKELKDAVVAIKKEAQIG